MPRSSKKRLKAYKSVKGIWEIFSLLQYAIKSESPFAMTLVKRTSAWAAAERSVDQLSLTSGV
jgi:hypothetical protein